MTKYIRIKTKIEEIKTTLSNKELFDYLKQFDNYKDDLIKVADTIEELCDEFVDIDNHDYYKIAHTNGLTLALSKTRRFMGHYDIRLKEIGQIMGAIWTEWGLKYVAKMNKKGEMELL